MANAEKNARMCAFKILYRIESEGAFSNIAIKDGLHGATLCDADKRLVTTIVYGCVKYRRYLDYIISLFSSVKLKKLSINVLILLRMGIYQIMKLDRVPDSAAVNESVRIAQKVAYRSKGLVNAVLRKVSSNRDIIAMPGDVKERLAVTYSYPDEIVDMWTRELGAEFTQTLLCAGNESPKLTVRVNTLKTDADTLIKQLADEGIVAHTSFIDNMLELDGGDVGSLVCYKNGLFTPQGIGSYLACAVLEPRSGDTVMDLCAAPGGKSTHIAELMKNEGKIHSFDIHEHKVELIDKNAQRLGIGIISTVAADTSLYMDKFEQCADAVLADVPCSGLGIIRKKPDIKWGFDISRLDELTQLQYGILSSAGGYVRRGGTLVYSTCTISQSENLGVVERFLNEHKDFSLCGFEDVIPDCFDKPTAKEGYVQFYPNIDGIDGFFICKMKRKE